MSEIKDADHINVYNDEIVGFEGTKLLEKASPEFMETLKRTFDVARNVNFSVREGRDIDFALCAGVLSSGIFELIKHFEWKAGE